MILEETRNLEWMVLVLVYIIIWVAPKIPFKEKMLQH